MAVSTAAGSFVEEIYDQFLVCRMCSEIYKTPKVLACMHTFCEKCLETHYEMEEQERPYRFLLYTRALSCPLCHSRTELPTGGVHRLPDNFLVANLADVVNRRKPGVRSPVCEICRPGSRRDETGTRNEADKGGDTVVDEEKRAVAKCLDCVKMLCRSCADLHRRTRVTQQHGLFDIHVEKDTECKLHPGEVIRFYCDPCEECICVLCTFHDHKDHDVSSLLDALERHRGPFEKLIARCGDRVDRLKEQVELIDRCELGLRLAEDHIRDSAIESIAAIRRREKDLLGELRETLGEQTLGFIAEKDTFKENLKNLEGTFQLTNAMLKGTSIDLLMVKKEMKDKLTAILDTGVKKTPDTLKRNVQLCHEDYYQDIRTKAFNNHTAPMMDRCIIGQKTKTRDDSVHGEPSKRSVRSVGTETDFTANSQSVRTTNDFVDGNKLKQNLSNGLDKMDDDDGDDDDDDDDEDDDDDDEFSEAQQNSVWQRPMAVVVVTEIPRTLGNIVLRPVTGGPRQADRMTQTRQTVVTDRWTSMPKVTFSEKETSTPYIHVLHKNVSTDNTTMVEKSTNTAVDVTATYRGAATTKRMVMVSRGTCTPRMMMHDKETLPLPGSSSASRGCSPVTWPGNTDGIHATVSRPDGSTVPAEHHTAPPQNVTVTGASVDDSHFKGSLVTAENVVSNQGSSANLGDNTSKQMPEVATEDTTTNQKSAANSASPIAVQAGQVSQQKPVAAPGEIASNPTRVAVPSRQLHNQINAGDKGSTAAAANKSPMANSGVQMPVQKPVGSAGGSDGAQSYAAVARGQMPVQRSGAVALSNVANQGPTTSPSVQVPSKTSPAILGGSLVAVPGGKVTVQKPLEIPKNTVGSQGSLAAPVLQSPNQKSAAVPVGNVGNQNPLAVTGGQATVQKPMAIPGSNISNQNPVANPGSQIPSPRPMTVPGSNFANQNNVVSPGSQMPSPRPMIAPGSNVPNHNLMASPGSQIPSPRPMTVPGSNFANQIPVVSPGNQMPSPRPLIAPGSNGPVANPGSHIPSPRPMAVQGSNVPNQSLMASPGCQMPAARPMAVPGTSFSNQIPLANPGGLVPARAPNTMMAGYVANQSQPTATGGNIAVQGQLAVPGGQRPAQRNMTVSENNGINQSPVNLPGSQTSQPKPTAAGGDIAKQGLLTAPLSQMAIQRPLAVPGCSDPKQTTSTVPLNQPLNGMHVAVTGGSGNTGSEVPSQRPSTMQGEAPNQRPLGNTSAPGPMIKPEERTSAGNTAATSGDPMPAKGNVVQPQPQPPAVTSPQEQTSTQSSVVNSNTAAPNVLGKTVSTLLSAIFPSTSANKQASNVQAPEQPK